MNGSARPVFAGGPPGWWAGAGAGLPVLLPVLFGGVGLAGSLANLLLLAVVRHQLRRGRLPPAEALLLLSLASSDLLLALVCLPARVATYARRSWPLGRILCRTSDWLLHGCLAAKSLAWAAVGQARGRGRGRAWGRRRLAATVGACWAAAWLLALPHLLFARLEGRPPPGGTLCCLFRTPDGAAAAFMTVFSTLYPLAACVAPAACAACGFWRAGRRREGRPARAPRLAKASRPARPGGAGLLWGLALLFHASWLPLWAAWLWERHSALARSPSSPPPPELFLAAAEALVFLDGALGPGLLLGLSPELRQGLKSLGRRLNCRQEEEEEGGRPLGENSPSQPAERPHALGRLPPERVLPDVEHFWKDRRNTAPGEESDPVPWEHQGGP
uniref:G-protein coupled receptor 151-like n=1 Tax=Pogona vitticeps TaxID=103695 RepID=A0ABM5GL77_9SAUR